MDFQLLIKFVDYSKNEMLDFVSSVTVYSLEIKRFFFQARMTCFDGLQKKSLKINK